VLSALHYRNRTGRGQHVDLAQVDVGSTLTGPAILDATVNKRPTRRPGVPAGNRSYWPGTPLSSTYRGPHAAPHNAYRCQGGGSNDWVAIACETEAEWQAFVGTMGNPSWANDARFASLTSRLENQVDMDAYIEAWTLTQGKYDVAKRLQEVGVPAAPVQSMSDRVERDPQTQHRGTFATKATHPYLGERIYEGMPMLHRNAPWEIWRHGPMMGGDNAYLFHDVLGLSEEEIESEGHSGLFWPRNMTRDGLGGWK